MATILVKADKATVLDRMAARAQIAGKAFWKGFKEQANAPGLKALATGAGIVSGLKYTGSIKRGLAAASIVYFGVSAFNGIHEAINADYELLEVRVKAD